MGRGLSGRLGEKVSTLRWNGASGSTIVSDGNRLSCPTRRGRAGVLLEAIGPSYGGLALTSESAGFLVAVHSLNVGGNGSNERNSRIGRPGIEVTWLQKTQPGL